MTVRLWHAIAKPPTLFSNRVVDDIARKIAEVKEEREMLLNERVRDMQMEIKSTGSLESFT